MPQSPLKYPDGWPRTRISDRKKAGGWKKTAKQYEEAIAKELARFSVADFRITCNPPGSDRQDPGVAVYFTLKKDADFSWQEGLGLFTPCPTLQEIDDAYRERAMQHHPDRGGDLETFKRMGAHREQAKAWVLGAQKEHEYVIPCDRYDEVRLNMAAIRMALAAMRQLDRVGIPGMLERSFSGMRTALPPGEAS